MVFGLHKRASRLDTLAHFKQINFGSATISNILSRLLFTPFLLSSQRCFNSDVFGNIRKEKKNQLTYRRFNLTVPAIKILEIG